MSRSHGSKICGSQQTVNLQIRQKKAKCPVHDCTQEQKRRSILFFHRSTIEMTITVKNDC